MKTFICFLTLIVAVLVLGCGKDGDDGGAYLRITWLLNPFAYYDNNPNIPDVFINNVYYPCCAGTYYFEYTAWDNSQYSGTYTLTINKGEEGKFLANGDDGADIYFTLQCLSIGPSFYWLKTRTIGMESPVDGNQDAELNAGVSSGAAPALSSAAKTELQSEYNTLGPIQKQTIVQGRYTLELVYQKHER